MAKLLHTSHLNSTHLRSLSSILSKHQIVIQLTPSLSPPPFNPQLSVLKKQPLLLQSSLHSDPRRSFSVRAFNSSSETKTEDTTTSSSSSVEEAEGKTRSGNGDGSVDDEYPSGEFEFKETGIWKSFVVKLRMLVAFPWERVPKGSVFTMKLRGQISDQLKSRFSSGLSLPQICENFIKAAYDPRVSGIYLHIEPLNCRCGKVEEIRRHILDFKKSGKFIVCYVPACGEKEYYLACACDELYAPPSAYFSLYGLTVQSSFLGGVFEKVGIEPQV